MKCIICHGEQISQAEVFEEIPVGSDIVRVPVRVMACETCGERYYDRATMRHLERVREDVTRNRGQLQVVGNVLQAS
jgi:YgiT-type zinc finger domain-containing protein